MMGGFGSIASYARLALLSVALGCQPAVVAAAPKEPVALKRIGSWTVNYDKDGCSLLATFGVGQDEITLQLTRFVPTDQFRMTLIGSPTADLARSDRITVDFGPVANLRRVETMKGTVDGKPMAVLVGSYRLNDETDGEQPITPEIEAAVNYLDLTLAYGRRYRLSLGRMDRPMTVMRQCTDDLVRSWGFDPAIRRSLSRFPVPQNSPGAWITSSDYPAAELGSGKMAIVDFRLNIDAFGKVTACNIQRATYGEAFKRRTCELVLQRARFEPARDAAGNPIAWYYANAVRFVVP